MEQFINDNIIWLLPCVSILLSMAIKAAMKPECEVIDLLDFGVSLNVAAITVVLSHNVSGLGAWLLVGFLCILFFETSAVRRYGWSQKYNRKLKWGAVLAADLIGAGIIFIATLYAGGYIS